MLASVVALGGCASFAAPPGQLIGSEATSHNVRPENVIFFDNFRGGANKAWGNERGEWETLKANYYASLPNNDPVTYTDVTTQESLKNFTVRVKVTDITDGGVWLRSSWNSGNVDGVLLVTGGKDPSYYDGFYWNVFSNGGAGGNLDGVSVSGLQHSTATLRIVVKGDKYSLYYPANAAQPLTTLTDATYSSGSAGLYDFSPRSGKSNGHNQRFTDFQISVP